MRRMLAAFAVVVLPLVAGCQSVADARQQFCSQVGTFDKSVTDIVSQAQTSTMTVGQLRTQVKPIRDALGQVQPVAQSLNIQAVNDALKTIDDLNKQLESVPDSTTVSSVVQRIKPQLDQLQTGIKTVNSAVCTSR